MPKEKKDKERSLLEKLRESIMSGAGDRRDKYLRELEEYSLGERKEKPRKPRK